MADTEPQANFIELTSDIVSAFVANNSVSSTELPTLIATVHQAFVQLSKPAAPEPEKPQPAVSIRKSVTPDYLVSLEDGRQYKSLKRHLTGRGLTPALYREKWGLPADYPMVAPNYAKQRSELAKSMGLGQQRKKSAAVSEAAPAGAKRRGPGRPKGGKATA